MQIAFGEDTYPFEPWRPEMGLVLNRLYSFCSGTTGVNEAYPWLTPAYVIGAAFDGERGLFIRRDRLKEFFAIHADPKIVFHGGAFELDVIATASLSAGLYARVDVDHVFDTQLMHRLLVLGEKGHAANDKLESTLKRCAATYLEETLPAGPLAAGNGERLSFARWLGRPTSEIEPDYLTALAVNAVGTRLIFAKIRTRTRNLLAASRDVWGFVSPQWLQDCINRFGYQTHHIQLKAAIVLRSITANGLHLDVARKQELEKSLRTLVSERKSELREYGYLVGEKGCDTSLLAVLKIRARRRPIFCFR